MEVAVKTQKQQIIEWASMRGVQSRDSRPDASETVRNSESLHAGGLLGPPPTPLLPTMTRLRVLVLLETFPILSRQFMDMRI